MGAVGFPNNTTVSPLRTEDTLANPDLGKMMGAAAVIVGVVMMMMMIQLRNRTREREERERGFGGLEELYVLDSW